MKDLINGFLVFILGAVLTSVYIYIIFLLIKKVFSFLMPKHHVCVTLEQDKREKILRRLETFKNVPEIRDQYEDLKKFVKGVKNV